ncbi:MAG: hypothetical protein ACOCXM_07005 [Myxococcota bacterium]
MASSLVSLALNRVVLRSLGEDVPHATVVGLGRWFAFPRNLAAIAGVVALTAALYEVLRRPRMASLRRRSAVAGLALVFLATIVLATVMPSDWTWSRPRMVLFGAGVGSILAMLLALIAVGWRGPLGLRTSVALFAISTFFALGALVGQTLIPSNLWELGLHLGTAMRGVGEVAYLLAPLAAVPSIRPLYPPRRARVGHAVGAGVGLAVLALFLWGHRALGPDFPTILYGAQRLELLLDWVPQLYGLPVGIGFGIGAAALVSSSAADRQAGTGLLLLLAAGNAPKSAAPLLMMVLGIALLARTLVSQAAAIQTSRSAEP